MRRLFGLVLLIAFLCGNSAFAAGPATRPSAKPAKLDLKLLDTTFKSAGKADVEAVLQSAGREMLAHFPDAKLPAIRVQGSGGPITLFKRDSDGAIRVKLNTGDTFWSQYAYQFSHELCHILCNYREGDPTNQWFEETLCETASLFALRAMAERWKDDPPYKNWKSYGPKLREYAQKRIDENPIPEGKSLAAWYAANADHLKKNATDREKNNIAAAALLPLFEADPSHWAAVSHLNDGRSEKPVSFQQYLQTWHDRTEKVHRPFVRQIAEKFGVSLIGG